MKPQLDDSEQTLEQARTQPDVPLCCRACGQVLATGDGRRIKSEHTFRNPAGYSFHVVVPVEARGLRLDGPAVERDSWFPGFAWRIALCGGCGIHLGWEFEGRDEPDFAGLIATRLSGLDRS